MREGRRKVRFPSLIEAFALRVDADQDQGAGSGIEVTHEEEMMKKTILLGAIGAALLLAAVPFSLQWSFAARRREAGSMRNIRDGGSTGTREISR